MFATNTTQAGLVQISDEQAWAILNDDKVENAPFMVLNLAGKMAVTQFVLENTLYGKRVPMGRWFDDAELQASENFPVDAVELILEREETLSGQQISMGLGAEHFDWYVQIPGKTHSDNIA